MASASDPEIAAVAGSGKSAASPRAEGDALLAQPLAEPRTAAGEPARKGPLGQAELAPAS